MQLRRLKSQRVPWTLWAADYKANDAKHQGECSPKFDNVNFFNFL